MALEVPPPTLRERWEIATEVGDSPKSELSEKSKRWWGELVEKIDPYPRTMLDIGCQFGRYSRWFAEQDFWSVGVDHVRHAVENAQFRNRHNPGARFVLADMADLGTLELPERPFGFIMDRNSSMFLPSRNRPPTLKQLRNYYPIKDVSITP